MAGSWRDLGGILAGSPRDSRRVLPRFWPPGFPFPAVNPGGILAGLQPGSRRDFGRRDFASRREPRRDLGGIARRDFGRRDFASRRESQGGTWRDLPPRFWPPGFCFLPRIPSGSWCDHPPRFCSPRFPFLAENLARIPPRFSARQDCCMEFDR